ncbi:hypothetical protein BVRB_2g039640 [Beta vulgaris subsp. vulgaris]|uniref:uncharacterized protein LOC104887257 n=1 Tax=Beta vulgaris subsp. vulgaris TaxID=3555 RepID=UPI0005402786|nr:uncharacterized protein LOC104887257 [Beta vulgaris subsp. vulgaris]XP_048494030.1 uncharacterized protein LOC125491512 [Beta vulgaris subsp. vulgaris]XP_048494031.1 uncharacterized protein LOC125491512 [Beta vulgaris subsp. vulgaris]XP_048494032.1 uncharacterized protein LOC125491512 [Beta vulgaris subsp. vulgaris]XP_057248393.1 uncharacterized protein LOC125491512 [Beta vulgaris subsp. vulgaris]KMT17264.1 hypothetical protein BVRB_2g039640 [Beta vulgaris subsp. vulgaris]
MANPSEASQPLQELNQSIVGCKTPPLPNHQKLEEIQNSANHIHDNCKCKVSAGLGTPDRLKLPKPFKFPERYTSPTDHMISPISKGLLARSRRSALLPPSIIQSKIHELRCANVEQNKLHVEQ